MRAIVRYHGAKWRIAQWVIDNLPEHECFVEAFAGSAAVLLTKPRRGIEVYNDADELVVNFFRVVRDQPEQLSRSIELTPYSRVEHRASFEETDDAIERARRFVVRAWQTWSGYQRGGRGSWGYQRTQGDWKTGRLEIWRSIPERIIETAARLQGVLLDHGEWLDVVRRYDAHGTLHYLDPPYLQSTRTFGRLYAVEFRKEEQHIELLAEIQKLKGHVVLSGYPSELYTEALHGWRRVDKADCRTSSNAKRTECLWLSPSCVQNSQQELFGVASQRSPAADIQRRINGHHSRPRG